MRTILLEEFPFLSDADVNKLLELGSHKVYKSKEFVHSQSGRTIPLYFILKGMVRGYMIDETGEERTLFIRPTRTFFTTPEMLNKERTSKFTFETIGETELLEFPFAEFEKLSNTNLSFARLYVELLKENVLTLVSRVEMLAGKSPEERYRLLLDEHPHFFQYASMKHIANYLGMTPNSLSRIIKRNKENL